MLDFTAFEASFNGSQQKFPIFNRNSPSLHIFRFPLARKGRSGRGWAGGAGRILLRAGPDAHQALMWAARRTARPSHPQNIDQQGKFGPFGFPL